MRTMWMDRTFHKHQSTHIPYLEGMCKTSNHIAIKIIRGELLNSVKPLLKMTNVKVLNLVRDPRGLVMSAINTDRHIGIITNMTVEYTTDVVHYGLHLCELYNKNIEFLQNNIHSNIKLIRYEDFAYHPIDTAQRLYSFLGLEFTKAQTDQLHEVTHADGFTDVFGTRRNSRKTAEGWRTSLPYNMVVMLQHKCVSALGHLGYSMIHSESELHDRNSTLLNVPQVLAGLS